MKKIVSSLLLITSALLTGCGVKVTKETEFSIKPTTTTIAYTKDGDPVEPLELVAIDRVEENSDATETEETVELADEAYVADGLEVTKVYPEVIDTSVVGDVEVLFTVKDTENNDSTSELSVTFTVFDETAPAFKLSKTDDTVTVGADFDPKSYIKADAGCEYVDEAPEDGSKYENGWYTITSNVSTKKAGKYKVIYHAENSSGTSTEVTLNITVKDAETASADNSSKAETKKSQSSSKQSNNSNSNASNNGGTSNSSSVDYTNGAGTDSYNGVIQTEGCNKTLVHHDALYKDVTNQVYVKDQDAIVEEWQECSTCGAQFKTSTEAGDHMISQNHGSYHNILKTIQEESGHYENQTTQELICPAYDEYVCQ